MVKFKRKLKRYYFKRHNLNRLRCTRDNMCRRHTQNAHDNYISFMDRAFNYENTLVFVDK